MSVATGSVTRAIDTIRARDAVIAGLRGQRAVAAVFAVVYTGDVLLNKALGLYEPSSWSSRDAAIDVIDKLVQAEATGAVFDHVIGRAHSS